MPELDVKPGNPHGNPAPKDRHADIIKRAFYQDGLNVPAIAAKFAVNKNWVWVVLGLDASNKDKIQDIDAAMELMRSMRAAEATYREIGEHFGISKQRAHQLLNPRRVGKKTGRGR